MKIEDYIPFGHENAISYDELVYQTGLNPRGVRKAIEESDAIILNLQDGKGFFRFDPNSEAERAFARKYSAQEKSRGWSCIRKAFGVDKALKQTEPNVFNGNLYRLARLLKGATIEEVAAVVGITPRAIKNVENGKRDYSTDELEKFEAFVGIRVKEGNEG